MTMINRSATRLAVLLLISAVWIGCDSTSEPPPPTPTPTGTLSGVVREAGTETPVPDISVELGSAQTMTDQDGRFEFLEVRAGLTTSIRTGADGFEDFSEQIIVQVGDNSVDISLVRMFELQFDHIPIVVSDFDKNATFYEEILQLKALESPWGPNSSVRSFSTGGHPQVHLIRDLVSPQIKRFHLAFSVQDFDAALSLLRAEGIEYGSYSSTDGSFQVRPDGVRQIYFQDPHGNWLEINDAQSSTQIFDPQFDHTAILVDDLDKSERFYRDILRLERLKSPFPPGERGHVFISIGNNGELHVVQKEGEFIQHNKERHLAFSLQHFEAYLGFLKEKGIEYGNFIGNVSEIDTRPDGVKQIYFKDPDGYWIEVNNARY